MHIDAYIVILFCVHVRYIMALLHAPCYILICFFKSHVPIWLNMGKYQGLDACYLLPKSLDLNRDYHHFRSTKMLPESYRCKVVPSESSAAARDGHQSQEAEGSRRKPKSPEAVSHTAEQGRQSPPPF